MSGGEAIKQSKIGAGIRAGDLDRRVVLYNVIEVKDETGAVTPDLSIFCQCWAQFEPMKGYQKFSAQMLDDEFHAIFRVRFRLGINTRQQLKHDGNFWVIYSVTEIGRREGIEIWAKLIKQDQAIIQKQVVK